MAATDTPSVTKKFLAGTALAVTVVSLLGGTVMGTPFLFWAYHIHQAGSYMEQGLVWPEPRYSDSLPAAVNATALGHALGHLHQASRWRSDHFHSYRLQAQVHTALGQWRDAEMNIARARQRAAGNPLVHLDAVIVYEQIMAQLASGARTVLWSRLTTEPGAFTAPPLDSICTAPADLATCDVLYEPVVLPVADLIPTLTWEAPYLGVKDGHTVDFTLEVPAEPSALSFLLGLHPDSTAAPPAAATMTMGLRHPGETTFTPIHQFSFTADNSRAGWIPGAIELTPWAGTTVEIRLSVDAPAQHAGWGQLTLADPDTAILLSLTPEIRWQEALLAGEFRSSDMEALIKEAENRGIVGISDAWTKRFDFLVSQGR